MSTTHQLEEDGPQNPYRMPRAEMEGRTRELLARHPPARGDRFACYRIPDCNVYSNVGRTVECIVFQEVFDNSPDVMREAYALYERHSLFFLVIDCELQEPAGCLRVVTHSDSGFKTLNDIALPPLSMPAAAVMAFHGIPDLQTCWDVATLAVLKRYRGQEQAVSTMLYGQFHAAAREAGIEHAIAVLDEHAYRQLTENFGVPFAPIAGTPPFDYLGSKRSRAAYVHVPTIMPAAERYMATLTEKARHVLKPTFSRVIYAEGLPEVVSLS